MMEPTALQITWFVIFGSFVAGYAVLDGFDLGVGALSLLRRDADERRLMINAIGPVWDGNEVWLLAAGGTLFAAFPPVYASVFSGLYLALVLLLVALIFRAVSMEFRGKVESTRWRRLWDLGFGLGSLLPAILLGVAVGNVMRGLHLDVDGNYTGTFVELLNPFALATGLLSLFAFVCHGAIYMALKGEGDLRTAMLRAATRAWIGWVALFVVATVSIFFVAPFFLFGALVGPLSWVAFLTLLAALIYVPIALKADRPGRAFVASSAAIVAMICLVGIGLFPNLVPSTGEVGTSLSIVGSASSERAQSAMLVIAGIGMPLVIAYTVFIYKVFKGKVRIGEDSY